MGLRNRIFVFLFVVYAMVDLAVHIHHDQAVEQATTSLSANEGISK
jgi:hypothetical protein